jgi:hypothetical protein
MYTYRPTPNRAESIHHVNTYHNACRPRSQTHHAALSRAGGLYKRLLMWHWNERDAVNDLLQPCRAARASTRSPGPLKRGRKIYKHNSPEISRCADLCVLIPPRNNQCCPRISGRLWRACLQFKGREGKGREGNKSVWQPETVLLANAIIARRVDELQWTRTTLGAASDAVAGSSRTLVGFHSRR